MNNYFTFIGNDLKIIFRDKTLMIMFFLPVILILVCRILVPFIAAYIPGMNNHYWIILAGFCILSGSTPAFLTAFLMLDEKDENLIPVLKVTPLPYSKLITYRISFLMVASLFFAIIFLLLNGLANYGILRIITTSILVSFVPAILLMLIIPFAKNKIEGVTLFKGVNSVLFIPIIAFFVAPEWKAVFGVIPFYWVYEVLRTNNADKIITSFLIGLLVNGAFLYLLIQFFNKTFMKRLGQ